MEIFSLMLKRQINNHPRFQYHFGCKPIKLVHVCFANDLLVMCHGDSYSVRVIKSALDEFSACYGLLPNNPKSTVFFGSLSEEEKSEILNVIPFTTGKLLVRYLGVPLIAKRLSVKDYGCLLDKIKSKIRNWMNRCLSYAGRLQLIVAVLEIKVSLLKAKQKLPGMMFVGLKIKVKWVHSVKLRWKSMWEISAKINDSWAWKNLLSIRDLIRNNVSSGLKVSDMVYNGQWRWPIEWQEKFPMITCLDVPAINTDEDDKICSFAEELWNKVTVIADIHTSSLALNEIAHTLISVGNGNNIRSIIRILAFAASIYSIWQERNGRIFRESKRSCDEVFKSMMEMIKNKLLGITANDSLAVRDIERRWAITCKRIHTGKSTMK
ncbi:hypothetical protein Tco_1211679 [Tanacetum coccineum]